MLKYKSFRPIFRPEFTCFVDDGAPAPQPTPTAPSTPASAPGDTIDWKAKFEEANRKSQSLEERFAGLETKFGNADAMKAELDAAKKRLDEQALRLKAVDEENAKATKALFEKIPEETRKKLEVFEKTMDAKTWHDFVVVQAAMFIESDNDDDDDNDDGPPKPPSNKKDIKDKNMKGRYKPKYANDIEDELGIEVEMLNHVIADKHPGGTTFKIDRKAYRNILKGKGNYGVKLDKESADKRGA